MDFTQKQSDLFLAEALGAFEQRHNGDEMINDVLTIREIVGASLEPLRQRTFGSDPLDRETSREQLKRAQEVWNVLNPRGGMRKAA